MDDERLIGSSPVPFEREMLRAAASESAPSSVRRRTLATLGLLVIAPPAAAATAAGSAVGKFPGWQAWLSKAGLAIGLGGAAVGAVAALDHIAAAPSERSAASSVSQPGRAAVNAARPLAGRASQVTPHARAQGADLPRPLAGRASQVTPHARAQMADLPQPLAGRASHVTPHARAQGADLPQPLAGRASHVTPHARAQMADLPSDGGEALRVAPSSATASRARRAPPASRTTLAPPTVTDNGSEARGAASIRGEIDLLDRARAAMRRGAPSAALVVLDEYFSRHPAGELRAEAALVRAQASRARDKSTP